MPRNMIDRMKSVGLLLLPFFPMMACLVFIYSFASPMPLTDEWLFLRSYMNISQFTMGGDYTFKDLLLLFPKIASHNVTVPFSLYLLTCEIVNFDSRFYILITFCVYVVIFFLFYKQVFKSSWGVLPVALLLFSPARYVEFQWGFQFTLALSILFPVCALFLLERYKENPLAHHGTPLITSNMLFLLGVFSSAGGFFGFVSCLPYILFFNTTKKVRIVTLCVAVFEIAVIYKLLFSGQAHRLLPTVRDYLYVTTALGASLWCSNGGMFSFSLNILSVTGSLLLILFIASIFSIRPWRRLSIVSLPLCLTIFSFLSIYSIALNREYLGNWHLAYVVPGICGIYTTIYIVYNNVKNTVTRFVFITSCIVFASSLYSYGSGFIFWGPNYKKYTDSIKLYALTYLEHPQQEKPFPDIAWSIDDKMTLFLSARNHYAYKVFNARARQLAVREEKKFNDIPTDFKIYVNGHSVPWSMPQASIFNINERFVYITVTIPSEDHTVNAVVCKVDNAYVVLRKIDPRLLPASIETKGKVCFSGMLIQNKHHGISHISAVYAVNKDEKETSRNMTTMSSFDFSTSQ